MAKGTIVDATIISAPSSTKNADQARDPDMHQTRRAISGTSDEGPYRRRQPAKIIHAVVATAANVADSQVLAYLLHGEETRVWGDQAIAVRLRRSKRMRPTLSTSPTKLSYRGIVDEIERARNRTKSKVRSKVEHAFHVIKPLFGFVMVRDRGLTRTLIACSSPAPSPTCSWRAAICCDKARSLS